MQLQTGEVLKHVETEAEAVYKAAIPTIGHGLIHLLVGAQGYILKFTHELEEDFNLPTTELPTPAVSDPLAGITAADVQALLAMARTHGGLPAADTAEPPADAGIVEGEPGLDKAPVASGEPQAGSPVTTEPVAPATGSGAIPL